MKKAVQIFMISIIGLMLTVSAGFAAKKKYSGFLGDYYKNLEPGPKDGAKERWLKPGVDPTRYNKFMIDSVVFYYADDSEDKGIDVEEMKELADAFNQELINALKDKYPIVAEPGPDVLRLKVAITNVKKSSPCRSAISSIVPIGLGISIIKKGATGSWSGSGGANAEFMALDSVSNEVLAVAVDERTAGFTERFTSLGAAKDAFKTWAERIRIFMDSTRAGK